MSTDTQLKLDRLEDATLRLVEQVSHLSVMIGELGELRRQQVELTTIQAATDSKAQIAMVNALAAQDDVNQLGPRLEAIAMTERAFSRRLVRAFAFFILTVLVATYAAVSAYHHFQDSCIRVPFLSETRAAVCNSIFIGDELFVPGPQYSSRLSAELAPLP